MVVAYFIFLMQCLRLLGYCAPYFYQQFVGIKWAPMFPQVPENYQFAFLWSSKSEKLIAAFVKLLFFKKSPFGNSSYCSQIDSMSNVLRPLIVTVVVLDIGFDAKCQIMTLYKCGQIIERKSDA